MTANPGSVLVWAAGAAVVVVVVAVLALRILPEHERAVVVRLGRVTRLAGPGLVAVLPGLERAVRVSVRDSHLDHLVTRATTRDGQTTWITAVARFHVVDPVRSTVAAADVAACVADAVDAAVRHELGRTDLKDLARPSTRRRQRLLDDVNGAAARWGAAVSDLDLVTIELELTPELVHWAETLPPPRDDTHAPHR